MNEIIINLEGRNEDCAFFALFAGLKMYSDLKAEENRGTNKMNIAGAEAYCMLYDLKEDYPEKWEEAKKEYVDVYGSF